MSTAARPAPPFARAPHALLLILALALLAFYPSYLSRLPQTDAVRHFHGSVAFAWMVLLVVQATLARMRKFHWHRPLGKAVYVIAPLFLASGMLILHDMASFSNPFQQAFGAQLIFVDLLAVVFYAVAVWQALRHRRDVQVHARWMISTALVLLPPVFARLIGMTGQVESFEAAFHGAFFATEAIMLAVLWRDTRAGKGAAAYWAVLGVSVLAHVGFVVVPHVPAWTEACRAFGTL